MQTRCLARLGGNKPSSRALALLGTLATLTALLVIPQAAQAQGNLIFSGGSGTPLSMTLTSPVSYTITSTPGGDTPFFVFQGVGDLFNFTDYSTTGTLTYSVNGGAAQTLTTLNSGAAIGSLTTNDLYLYGTLSSLTIGDTVLLSAGTLTTTGNVAASAPPDGAYSTFIADAQGTQVSNLSAASAPEPTSLGLLALGGLPVLLKRRRK